MENLEDEYRRSSMSISSGSTLLPEPTRADHGCHSRIDYDELYREKMEKWVKTDISEVTDEKFAILPPSQTHDHQQDESTAQSDPQAVSSSSLDPRRKEQGAVVHLGRHFEILSCFPWLQAPSRSHDQRDDSTAQSNPQAPPSNKPPKFNRHPPKGKLWSPDEPVSSRSSGVECFSAGPQRNPGKPSTFTRRSSTQVDEESKTWLIKQPVTNPISQGQLVAEVKGIYAGLVMVESKAIEVCSSQNAQHDPANNKFNNEQWQALLAIHRTLLHEHHDFFLASQHPSASSGLRRLASKYAMPARMWRHGIHGFLELLRHWLPASLDHMLAFIYLAYSMMALLYETVPTFKDTWIECLGDLGRYRMAIEDDDIKDREAWTAVSRGWYAKASEKAPTTGRLYHHLAILARPNALQQLYYYTKSLCVAVPFVSARESVRTLFDPIMALPSDYNSRLPAIELAFIRCHGCMFPEFPQDQKPNERLERNKSPKQEMLEAAKSEFILALDSHIDRSGWKFLEYGYYIAISNTNAVIGYSHEENPIYRMIREQDQPRLSKWTSIWKSQRYARKQLLRLSASKDLQAQKNLTANAVELTNQTHGIVFMRSDDANILAYTHVTLAFIYHMTFYPDVLCRDLAPGFPWKLLAAHLNTLLSSPTIDDITLKRIEGNAFPEVVGPANESPEEEVTVFGIRRRQPLPEDFAMRGLLWTDKYLPDEYFFEQIDDKYFEIASMTEQRRERVLYLACRIAERGGGKYLSHSKRCFTAGPDYNAELAAGETANAANGPPRWIQLLQGSCFR